MTYRIRCSMLPAYGDCARRTVGRQYPKLLVEHGFELRKTLPSVGAAIGTAVHAAAAAMLRVKRDGPPNPEDQLDPLASFREEIANGVEWDATTPRLATAEKQIASLIRAYLLRLKDVEPVLIEQDFKATVPNCDGWELTGRLDLYTADKVIDDLKTGALPRPYIYQLGGYALLMDANGYEVRGVGTTFVKRVGITKPQPEPVPAPYDLDTALKCAWAAIQEIRRDVEAFAETGNPYTLRANPMSMMCSQKYCPAWGTAFCTVHQKGKE